MSILEHLKSLLSTGLDLRSVKIRAHAEYLRDHLNVPTGSGMHFFVSSGCGDDDS